MVDFHLPRKRLRQTPYDLKPYTWDSKTSVGPGPPTQILVTGFNPLVPFSKVINVFASFGAVAESSNKMHPENGSYLGFATFRYKDTSPGSRATPATAIEAARRAVRNMSGRRIDANVVKVEFDPQGKKSRRMLEAVLQKEKEASAPSRATTTATSAFGRRGPIKAPPTAPRGPTKPPTELPVWVQERIAVKALVEETVIAPSL
jgi:[histone H3]-lysine4 N-trimethyltransferase SETD1